MADFPFGPMQGTTSGPSFVSATIMAVADVIANFPPSADTQGKYARVNDLYGSLDEIMRCRFDGTNYRWIPIHTDFNGALAGSGTVTLTPLVTPPMVRTSGGLLGNLSVNVAITNAYVGQRFRVIITGSLGLYTATITGLVGSNLTLLGNSYKDVEYTSAGWFAV